MLNQILVMGRLTNDPEIRQTATGHPVANFTIACERDYKSGDSKITDFIDVTAWNSSAEFVQKYFAKGRMAIVSGSLESSKWKDNNGNNRVSWSVNARNIYFGDSKPNTNGTTNTGFNDGFVPTSDGFMNIPDGVEDEGLPFN